MFELWWNYYKFVVTDELFMDNKSPSDHKESFGSSSNMNQDILLKLSALVYHELVKMEKFWQLLKQPASHGQFQPKL